MSSKTYLVAQDLTCFSKAAGRILAARRETGMSIQPETARLYD